MQRDVEVAVIVSDLIAGNGLCLPAGPLREAPGTLRHIDFVITRAATSGLTDWQLKLEPGACVRVDGNEEDSRTLESFSGRTVHAVAGIGNPDGFFSSLHDAGLDVIEHPFPDHHNYTRAELEFGDGHPVIMTEKDAVKCSTFADPYWWALTVSAAVDEGILETIENKLQETVRSG
jgi:tetraacyldisaccharide 4'-kinase